MKHQLPVFIFAFMACATQDALSYSPPKITAKRQSQLSRVNRAQFLSTTIGLAGATLIPLSSNPGISNAFDGGVGGLGKTKPETGVQFFSDLSAPVQNSAGIVSAELNVNNQPVLVNFQTPWPLLPSTSGLEARDLQQPESAFVQVVRDNVPSERPLTKVSMKKLLFTSVFASKGKFGAYGAPTDIKVKTTDDPSIFAVSFVCLTPGMRESERQVFVKYSSVGKSALVLLVTGTTTVRFKKQQAALQKVANSFSAVAAPSSKLR